MAEALRRPGRCWTRHPDRETSLCGQRRAGTDAPYLRSWWYIKMRPYGEFPIRALMGT
jgi:hypothetical protein